MLCRFRTYFPDAYKEHYPNARTHLSSKVRSTLPDGSSLFEKTRSKKRRPFSEEEDRALKAGYEKHGTVWAAIVKDPIFKGQGRRSTDLRDRFRNAFPELYQAAGYKPRNSAKKKLTVNGASVPVRAATDDQLAMSTSGPVRSRRRSHTNQGLLRGGTKSVPQSTAVSEDEESSGGEDETTIFKTPHTPVLVPNVPATLTRSRKSGIFDDEEMDMVTLGHPSDPHSIPDFLSSSQSSVFSQLGPDADSQSQTWSSGINTPTHSMNAWSTAGASPTSPHLSTDYLASNTTHSPSFHRRGTDPFSNFGMIGKSAWGTQDWFSANPRLETPSASSPSFPSGTGGLADGPFSTSPTSGSPFSFSPTASHAHAHALNLTHLAHHIQHNQGVLDRYDLHPSLFPHDFASEVGDAHSSTFSDEIFPPSGFRGFTHHSNYAGDLIFGARTLGGSGNPHGAGLSGFGFGAHASGIGAHTSDASDVGLGLSGGTGIHPLALSLPGIDEIELTGISLDDDVHNMQNAPHHDGGVGRMVELDDSGIGIMVGDLDVIRLKDISPLSPQPHPEQGRRQQLSSSSGGEEVAMMSASPVSQRELGVEQDEDIEPRFTLDDLVDLSAHEMDGEDIDLDLELHATPPATPVLSHSSRSLTRLGVVQGQGYHGRSISVPPSEARGEGGLVSSSQSERKMSGRRKKVAFGQREEDGQTQDAMALDLATSTNTMASGVGVHGRSRGQWQTQSSHATPASAGVAVAPPPRSTIFSPPILLPSSPPPGPVAAAALSHYPFRPGTSTFQTSMTPGDVNLHLSFLDLHYHSQAVGATMNLDGLHGMDPQSLLRQGQALDLASTYTASLGSGLANSVLPLRSTALGISSAASLRQQVLQPSSDGRVGHGRAAAPSSFGMAGGGVGGRPVTKGVPLPRTPRSHSSHSQAHSPYQPVHQRRQSAVCPQDLVLRSGDNKRKRASWDGAPT